MTCCIEGCNREAKHEATYGRICDHHLRQDQAMAYEAYQERAWRDGFIFSHKCTYNREKREYTPHVPRMPDHMRSKGLQEEARRIRQAEEGIEE